MIRAKKSFGQNFLKNNMVIEKIVSSISFTSDDLIIEIGPGKGALTKELKKNNARVLAFEIDERMHEYLDALEDENIRVIYKDILSVNLINVLTNFKYKKLYVIANLPYYITTPIIEKLINLDVRIDELTVMVQNEVADRFCAKPCSSNYGLMTVLLNYKYNLRKLFIVNESDFDPAPKVKSAVVNFEIKDDLDYKNIDINLIKKFLIKAFSHKRKTLKNNVGDEMFGKISEILLNNNLPLNVRAEEISLDVYVEICNKLYY